MNTVDVLPALKCPSATGPNTSVSICFDKVGENRMSFDCRIRGDTVEYEIGTEEPVSMAVIRAVSAVEGREPQHLRPLGEVLDTDALDALFDVQGNGSPRTGGRVSFTYSNCEVSVDNGEYLTLDLLDSRFENTDGHEP